MSVELVGGAVINNDSSLYFLYYIYIYIYIYIYEVKSVTVCMCLEEVMMM